MNPRSVEFLRTYAESLKILASSGGVSDEDANAIESIEWACEQIERMQSSHSIVSYATSAEANFETMQWIFAMEPECRVFAGRCAIIPADDLARMTAQRDELLAALQKYVDHFGDPLQCARAAIASASRDLEGQMNCERSNEDDHALCRRCGGHMSPGIALAQTLTGSPDFPDGEVVTLSAGGPGKIIDCLKCEECGWSVSRQHTAPLGRDCQGRV